MNTSIGKGVGDKNDNDKSENNAEKVRNKFMQDKKSLEKINGNSFY